MGHWAATVQLGLPVVEGRRGRGLGVRQCREKHGCRVSGLEDKRAVSATTVYRTEGTPCLLVRAVLANALLGWTSCCGYSWACCCCLVSSESAGASLAGGGGSDKAWLRMLACPS